MSQRSNSLQNLRILTDDDNSAFYASLTNEFNCDFYHDPPELSEDGLNENTDMNDDIDDIINIIGANTKLVAFPT
jgi:hypothetical protein